MFRKAVRSHVLKKKDDPLGSLLQETIQRQREEIRLAMMEFKYFHKWPEDKVHQACVHSNIMTYTENEIVHVKDDANVDVAHFILSGKVTIIQRIVVAKCKSKRFPGKYYYKLCKTEENHSKNLHKNQIIPVYMQVCHLLKGATFGLGEELCKHIIIANEQTKCLLIPRHIILQYYSLDNIWQKIILFLNTVYPTKENIFQQFLLGRKWKEYCNYLSRPFTENNKKSKICIHDVPLTCRADDIVISKAFKKAETNQLYLIGERNVSFLDILENKQYDKPK